MTRRANHGEGRNHVPCGEGVGGGGGRKATERSVEQRCGRTVAARWEAQRERKQPCCDQGDGIAARDGDDDGSAVRGKASRTPGRVKAPRSRLHIEGTLRGGGWGGMGGRSLELVAGRVHSTRCATHGSFRPTPHAAGRGREPTLDGPHNAANPKPAHHHQRHACRDKPHGTATGAMGMARGAHPRGREAH